MSRVWKETLSPTYLHDTYGVYQGVWMPQMDRCWISDDGIQVTSRLLETKWGKVEHAAITTINSLPYMERQMKKAGEEIAQKKARNYPRMSSFTRRRFQKVMGPYLAVEHEYDKGFYTNDRCIGCGTCAKVCPNRNIRILNKRPVWNHHCHGCNACVVYCPTKAIQFKTPKAYQELGTFISRILCLPEKRKRYHHPLIKAKDLMRDKTEISHSTQ